MAFQPGQSGNPNGRPKLTPDDFPEGWAEHMISLYSEGASDVEIRAAVFGGMGNDTWNRLLAEEPLFRETVTQGRELAHAWWLRTGRLALFADKFQNGPYALHMKNRFGWADKSETKTEHSGSLTVATKEQRDAAVAAALDADS